MDRKTSILISMIFWLCVTSLGIAQQTEVEGKVTDVQSNEVLPGVNVMVKGTTTGTFTDVDGEYKLTVESLQDTLIFSFVGFQTQEVPVNGRTPIDVQMVSRTISGEELVVVGYGEQTQETVTASISTVSNEEISKSPAINLGNSLSGKVTGVQTIQRSGLPGGDKPELFLRGVSSLSQGRSHPLVIVDGVRRDMFQLEPNNIKSISILKDAAATAVYGLEGANGVVLVETKRGQKGPIEISADFSTGIQRPTNLPEFIGSYRYAKLYNEAQLADGISSGNLRFTDKAIEAFRTHSNPQIYPDTDWVDYILKPNAFQTRNSISLSGGTDDVKYFVSGGYLKQDGLFKTFNSNYDFNPSFKKYNIRTNLDIDVTPTTRLALTGYGRVGSRTRVRNQGNFWANIYHGAPFAGAGIVDGKLVTSGYGENNRYISCCKQDPLLRYFGQGYNLHVKNTFNIDLSVRQKLNFITKGLTFAAKGSYNTIYEQNKFRSSSRAYYMPYFKTDVDPSAPGDSTIVYRKGGAEGELGYDENYNRGRNWYMEARLNYKRSFGKHKVGGLLLFNQRKVFYPPKPRGTPRGLVGLVGRADYNYDDRYLLQVNMGYNGSENFAKGRRFGLFPSISGGWILTNEQFMKSVNFLDHLKLRASYGIVGNDQGVGRFLYQATTYNFEGPGYSFGYEVPQNHPDINEGKLGNPLVQWETAKKQNYGIDLRLLRNRLDISVDYFHENRTNILTSLNTVPDFVGANLPAVNVGKVKNQGYEAEVKWQQHVGDDFSYHIAGNVSYARNEIVYMDEVNRQESYLYRTGHPVGQPFGYIFDGFFTEQDLQEGSDVPDHPFVAKPGDLKFKDLNDDGTINSLDQKPVGYPQYPEYTLGATIGFNYKNFDFTTVWAGATHASRVLQYEPFRSAFGPSGGKGAWSTFKWQVDGAWTPEKGQDATFPRLSTTLGQRWNKLDSDFWTKDASYLRLKNAEIGYNFSPGLLNNIGIRNMRVYVNGYNLLTFSNLNKYSLDPEQDTKAGNTDYPVVSVYNFGINLTF